MSIQIVLLIIDRLKISQNWQNSYVDNTKRDQEFKVSDWST